MDSSVSTQVVLICMLIQFTFGLFLVLRSAVLMFLGRNFITNSACSWCRRKGRQATSRSQSEEVQGSDSSTADEGDEIYPLDSHPRQIPVTPVELDLKCRCMSSVNERERHLIWQEARSMSLQLHGSIFCGHVRSEENFIRGNDDPQLVLPPSSPMEVEAQYHSRLMLYRYLWTPAIANVIALSFGWALIAGGIGSAIVWSEEACSKTCTCGRSHWRSVYGELSSFLDGPLDFQWLPLFMLGGMPHFTFSDGVNSPWQRGLWRAA